MLELFDNAADERREAARLRGLAKGRKVKARNDARRAKEAARAQASYGRWLTEERELYGAYRAGEAPRKRWAAHWAACPLR